MPEPATTRGRETRERIVLCAARLFHARGVNDTSLDEVLAVADAGKGQFYRYFASKEQLAAAVVERQLEVYLEPQLARVERLERWDDLEAYLDELVTAHHERGLVGGCPVGSLALDLTGHDPALRSRLAEALAGWRGSLAVAVGRLVARDELRSDAPAECVAASLLAAIQGAYLLSTVEGDAGVMRDAIRATLMPLDPRHDASGGTN